MKPPNRPERINLVELKARIVKKVGSERSEQYFHYLNKLLSLRLSKVEFEKLCLKLLGKENVSLHNELMRSILQNAVNGKVPPPRIRKGNFSPHNSKTKDGNGMLENGTLSAGGTNTISMSDRSKIQAPPGVALCSASADRSQSELKLAGIARCSRSCDGGVSTSTRSQLQAPFGVSFYPVSASTSEPVLPLTSYSRCSSSCYSGGLLPDTDSLRERMEKIAAAHGLEGVSVDCTNLLNQGLDTYLKSLVRSCTDLVWTGSRNSKLPSKNLHRDPVQRKIINGVLPITMLDFQAAMELRPQQLGENWPVMLERIQHLK